MAIDPRTDREHLRTVTYGSGDLLADRQQLYRFRTTEQGPITDWLFGLVGGAGALPSPVIDVGTGSGQYLLALERRMPAFGFDLSEGMLVDARAGGWAGPLAVADAMQLPLRDSSVGTALANHMLYHVPDIAAAARELRRVLCEDGVLLAVTNGAGHIEEIGRVLEDAVREVAGDDTFHVDRSGERFTLEAGGDVLRVAFRDVQRHDRYAELAVPDAEPVLRYLASMVGLEPSFPEGVTFAQVMQRCEPRVRETLERDGVFRVRVHAGAFVCRS